MQQNVPVETAYSKLICVTDRHLVQGDFLTQIERVAALHPPSVILREKDLDDVAYATLSKQVQAICKQYGVPLLLHGMNHLPLVAELGCEGIHLPYQAFMDAGGVTGLQKSFSGLKTILSVSCYSKYEALTAAEAGATQIVLGTIFETNCKPGKEGAGLEFLTDVCRKYPIPVYAIGGIKPGNLPNVLQTGAAGGCMMSGYMNMK